MGEARLRKTELGAKIEMSNYQMMPVDSGISVGILGKFSLLAPKRSTAVHVCVCVCVCTHTLMQKSPANTHPAVTKNHATYALNFSPTIFYLLVNGCETYSSTQ